MPVKGRRPEVPARYKMIAVEPGVYEEVKDLMHERKLRSMGQAVKAAVSEVRASA